MLARGQSRINGLRAGARLRGFRWLPVAFWMAAVFYLSPPSGPLGPVAGGVGPLLAQTGGYTIRASLLYSAIAPPRNAAARWVPASIAFALAGLYGVSDEVHQAFVPGRIASEADVLADAFGAAIGVAIVLIASQRLSLGPRNP